MASTWWRWTAPRRSPPSRTSSRSSPAPPSGRTRARCPIRAGWSRPSQGFCRALRRAWSPATRGRSAPPAGAGSSTAAMARSPHGRRWWRSGRGPRTCSVRSAIAFRLPPSAAITGTTLPRAMRRCRGRCSTRSAATSCRRWTRASASPPARNSPAAMRRSRRSSSRRRRGTPSSSSRWPPAARRSRGWGRGPACRTCCR